MTQDISAVMWKELRELVAGRGGSGWRGWVAVVFVLGMFGVLLPLQAGVSWLTSGGALLLCGGYLPIILILTVAADSFAGERERHTLETLLASRLSDNAILFGKLFSVTLYGWGQSLVAALLGALMVNLAHPAAAPVFYPREMALGIVCLSLLTALLGGSASCLVSLRAATVRQAQQTLSIALGVLLVALVFGFSALPKQTRLSLMTTILTGGLGSVLLVVCLALLVVDIALIAAARARFTRSKLILE